MKTAGTAAPAARRMRLSDHLDKCGRPCALISDGDFLQLAQCTRVRDELSLTFLENPKYAALLDDERISCVLCTQETLSAIPAHIRGVAVTNAPKAAFFRLHNYLAGQLAKVPTVIDPTARISPLAYIAPYNVTIGPNVEIEPFVTVNEGSVIHEDARICAGTVIGSQGYNAVKEENDTAFIVRDAGATVIGKGVQIGSNCNIERGSLQTDVTELGPYCMIDNGVLVGHGTVMGRRGLVAAETIISGNCTFGDRIWIGVNGTVSNAIHVGDDARISLGAVVTKDVPAGTTVSGNFAIEHQRFLRNLKASLAEPAEEKLPPPGEIIGPLSPDPVLRRPALLSERRAA